jgi:hypothetical protein
MHKDFLRVLAIIIGMLACDASAHLVAGSLRPAGGDTFKAGERIPIRWTVEQEHSGSYQVSYSIAPATWVIIYDGLRNNGGRFDQPMDTAWTIPANMSTNSTGEPGNNNAGDSSTFYVLVSRNFTVTGAVTHISALSKPASIESFPQRVLMAQVDGRLVYREPSSRLVQVGFQVERR